MAVVGYERERERERKQSKRSVVQKDRKGESILAFGRGELFEGVGGWVSSLEIIYGRKRWTGRDHVKTLGTRLGKELRRYGVKGNGNVVGEELEGTAKWG